MLNITKGCVGAGLAILLCVGFYAAWAQENGPATPAPGQKTRQAPIKPVASPSPQGHTPRMIGMDILIAEVATRKAEGSRPGSAAKQLNARDLSGPMDEVFARVERFKKTGQINYFRRIQLSASEAQQASVSIGETRPTVTGLTTTATGLTSRNITYHNMGTSVKVTPRVAMDGQIMLELNLDDTRGHVPEDGVAIGTDEKGQPVRAEEWVTAKLTTKLSVASGQAKAAEVATTSSTSGQVQTLVIAGARIEEP